MDGKMNSFMDWLVDRRMGLWIGWLIDGWVDG